MAAPELLYPYHPEVWQEIGGLSVAALSEAVVSDSTEAGEPFSFHRWRTGKILAGIAARLERPLQEHGDNTVHMLSYEISGTGRLTGEPFIEDGLRYPRWRNPRAFGIVNYSVAQGVLALPGLKHSRNHIKLYVETIAKKDVSDPEQFVEGIEILLKNLLAFAPEGWQPLTPLPDFNAHLR